MAIESFEGKVFFCRFSVNPMVSVAISHYLPQIVLRAFRLGPTLRTNVAAPTSLPSLYSLVADKSIWAMSPLAAVHNLCVCVCVCVSYQLCCPLRFQNSPQTSL